MRRVVLLRAALIATLIALITVSVAFAGWGGVFGASTLKFTGTYSGVGNADATYSLTAYGTGTCINPGGQGPVPGQSGLVAVSATFTSVTIDDQGTINFEGVVLASDACPNSAWISNVVWTNATAMATYSKSGKQVQDVATFTCTAPDSNGHQICTQDGYNGNKYH
jgi:hypothetical protein